MPRLTTLRPRIATVDTRSAPVPVGETYDRFRGSAYSRGYDRAWTRLRNHFLRKHPLCRMCEEAGIIKVASEVDHRVPITIEPSKRLDWGNLQSLCHEHHMAKTEEDRRYLTP